MSGFGITRGRCERQQKNESTLRTSTPMTPFALQLKVLYPIDYGLKLLKLVLGRRAFGAGCWGSAFLGKDLGRTLPLLTEPVCGLNV